MAFPPDCLRWGGMAIPLHRIRWLDYNAAPRDHGFRLVLLGPISRSFSFCELQGNVVFVNGELKGGADVVAN